VTSYQKVTDLTLGELWAIPIMLRLALIENLRASEHGSSPEASTGISPPAGGTDDGDRRKGPRA